MERSLVPGQGSAPAGRLERQFEPEQAVRFAERSVSEETRRAYQRVVREFFAAIGNPAPMAVTVANVQGWRDALLRRRRQKAATVAFKLNVLRAFFGYLVAMGMLEKNPADVRFVIPPRLPESMAGRALTTEEVRRMLCGPDRHRPEGARDYAILLVMLRLGMRVSEVCSLKASDLHWSHGRWIVRFRVKGGRERTLPVPDEGKPSVIRREISMPLLYPPLRTHFTSPEEIYGFHFPAGPARSQTSCRSLADHPSVHS